MFRRENNTLPSPVTPLDNDPFLLNMSAFTGVSLPDFEMELADNANTVIWVSNSKALTAKLEDVPR